jgi:thiamine kinase-like enzyme
MASIQEVIDRVDEWKGKKIEIEELTSGLTNQNFKVTVNGKKYVVRIPGHGSDIFIRRDVELHNTLSASKAGVGARVFYTFESDYVIISEFLKGTTMSVDGFRVNRGAIVRAVKAIKKVNTEARFTSNFIMFDKFDDYLAIVEENSIRIPEHFNEGREFVERARKRFTASMPELVSCHNDLLAENFIDQGDRMRIIDWELSGLNEACFELGDFSVEQGFTEEENRLILETYFGGFDEQKYARMSVYKYMADMLWTLWAVILNHFSKLDFDYWSYGMNRFNRAMEAFHGDDFGRWLEIG